MSVVICLLFMCYIFSMYCCIFLFVCVDCCIALNSVYKCGCLCFAFCLLVCTVRLLLLFVVTVLFAVVSAVCVFFVFTVAFFYVNVLHFVRLCTLLYCFCICFS